MKRREFITLLGGVAARPRITHAQAPMKPPTIGFLGSATPLAWSHWIEALRQRLRKLGWIEKRTVFIEYRRAEGRDDPSPNSWLSSSGRKLLSSSRQQVRQPSQQNERHLSFRSYLLWRAIRLGPGWLRV